MEAGTASDAIAPAHPDIAVCSAEVVAELQDIGAAYLARPCFKTETLGNAMVLEGVDSLFNRAKQARRSMGIGKARTRFFLVDNPYEVKRYKLVAGRNSGF